MKKKLFFNVFDIAVPLIAAALICAVVLLSAPRGKTVKIYYTISVSDGNSSALSEDDTLEVLTGGCLGKVRSAGHGYIEMEADAELHAGGYYSGSVPIKDGEEYEFCCGANRFVGTVHRISTGG